MHRKLDARYDYMYRAMRIQKMSELVSEKYVSICDNIYMHVDNMAALIEQLRSMSTTFEDALDVGISCFRSGSAARAHQSIHQNLFANVMNVSLGMQ